MPAMRRGFYSGLVPGLFQAWQLSGTGTAPMPARIDTASFGHDLPPGPRLEFAHADQSDLLTDRDMGFPRVRILALSADLGTAVLGTPPLYLLSAIRAIRRWLHPRLCLQAQAALAIVGDWPRPREVSRQHSPVVRRRPKPPAVHHKPPC